MIKGNIKVISDRLYINHFHFEEITSTQTYAKQINLLPDRWTLISADQQLEGKGRMDSNWKSSACGNIYATLIVPLDKKHMKSSIMLPQVIAFSIIEILTNNGFKAKLKWINDIFINNKKVCGILCEQRLDRKLNMQKLLIGFGINVNATIEEFVDLNQPATSLFIESGKNFDEKRLLYKIIENIYYNLNLFFKEGFNCFLYKIINFDLLQYKNELVTLELPQVSIDKNTNLVCGQLIGLSSNGGIVLAIDPVNIRGKVHKVFNFGKLRLKEI